MDAVLRVQLCVLLCGAVSLPSACGAEPVREAARPALASTALADYVAKPDDSFQWKVRRTGTLGSGTYAELTLTSQTWRETPWRHQLFLYKPARLDNAAQGLMMI